MADARVWMPFYVGSYIKNTRRLKPAQHGAYLMLMLEYWNEQAPLPDNDEELATIAGMSATEWADTRPKLERFFTIADGAWRHERIDEEIEKANANVARAKQNGKKGGRPPKKRVAKNPEETQDQTQKKPTGFSVGSKNGDFQNPDKTQSETPSPSPSPSPLTSNQEPSPSEDLSNSSDEESSSADRRRDSDDEGLGEQFEVLWAAYSPLVRKSRREKKEACRAAWDKARKVHDPPDIHRGCIAYAESEGEYAKALVRTLRDGNYEAFIDPDEPDLSRPSDRTVATDPHRLAGRAGWARALEATQVVGPADSDAGRDASHGASSLRALPDARGTEGGGHVD